MANLGLLFRETAQDNGFCFCRFEANIGFWRRRIFFDAFGVIGMERWLEMGYYFQPAITCSKLTIKIMTLF